MKRRRPPCRNACVRRLASCNAKDSRFVASIVRARRRGDVRVDADRGGRARIALVNETGSHVRPHRGGPSGRGVRRVIGRSSNDEPPLNYASASCACRYRCEDTDSRRRTHRRRHTLAKPAPLCVAEGVFQPKLDGTGASVCAHMIFPTRSRRVWNMARLPPELARTLPPTHAPSLWRDW